jgi:hypothetical protein
MSDTRLAAAGDFFFGAFFLRPVHRQAPEPGEKDGVGQLVMTLLSLAASWRSPRPVEELTRRVQPLLTAPHAGGGLTLVGAIKTYCGQFFRLVAQGKSPARTGLKVDGVRHLKAPVSPFIPVPQRRVRFQRWG